MKNILSLSKNEHRLNLLNSGSVLYTGKRLQSGPLLCSGAKGRNAAYQCLMGPKAAKRFFIVQRGLLPVFCTLLEFSEFTLTYFIPIWMYSHIEYNLSKRIIAFHNSIFLRKPIFIDYDCFIINFQSVLYNDKQKGGDIKSSP